MCTTEHTRVMNYVLDCTTARLYLLEFCTYKHIKKNVNSIQYVRMQDCIVHTFS